MSTNWSMYIPLCNKHTHTQKILQNLFSLHRTMSSLLSPDTWICPRSQLSHQLLLNNKEWQSYFRLDFALWVCLGEILIRLSLLFQSLRLTSEGQNFAWHAEKLALYSKTESEGARRMLKYPLWTQIAAEHIPLWSWEIPGWRKRRSRPGWRSACVSSGIWGTHLTRRWLWSRWWQTGMEMRRGKY